MSVPAVQWLLRLLPSPCETNNPDSTAQQLPNHAPGYVKPQLSTTRLPISALSLGRGGHPGAEAAAARAAPNPEVQPWDIGVSATGTAPLIHPLATPSKVFWCHRDTSEGQFVLLHPAIPAGTLLGGTPMG